MSVRDFVDSVNWCGNTHTKCGQHNSKGWRPGLEIRKKASLCSSIHCSQLPDQHAMGPVASNSCNHAFPIILDSTLKLWAKINPSYLQLFLITAMRENSRIQISYDEKEFVPGTRKKINKRIVTVKQIFITILRLLMLFNSKGTKQIQFQCVWLSIVGCQGVRSSRERIATI